MTTFDHLQRPAGIGLLIALLAALVLGTVNYFEHVEGLAPCKLCLYQRVPWWIALGLGCAAILLRNKPRLATISIGIAALALAANAVLAGYHAGVEYHWWAGPTGCSGDTMPDSFEALGQSLQGPPPPRCDETPWSLFGLSMAAYNMLLSVGAAIGILWLVRRAR